MPGHSCPFLCCEALDISKSANCTFLGRTEARQKNGLQVVNAWEGGETEAVAFFCKACIAFTILSGNQQLISVVDIVQQEVSKPSSLHHKSWQAMHKSFENISGQSMIRQID